MAVAIIDEVERAGADANGGTRVAGPSQRASSETVCFSVFLTETGTKMTLATFLDSAQIAHEAPRASTLRNYWLCQIKSQLEHMWLAAGWSDIT